MSALTTYLANSIRGHVLLGSPYTAPATLYLALFTTPTTDAGGGTEVVGGSYARQVIALSAGTDGVATQTSDIYFTDMPSCTISHAAIMDALSGGNMLLHASLPGTRTISAGLTLKFQANDINFLFD